MYSKPVIHFYISFVKNVFIFKLHVFIFDKNIWVVDLLCGGGVMDLFRCSMVRHLPVSVILGSNCSWHLTVTTVWKTNYKNCIFLLNQICNDKSYRSGPHQALSKAQLQPLMPVSSLIWRVCEEMPEAVRARWANSIKASVISRD